MALNAAQRRIARIIVQEGRRAGATRQQIVAGLSAGLVESNLTNIRRAVDHDSLGVFQQRPSAGWGSPRQVTNPHYAARKFFSAAKRVGRSSSAGRLAQSVQRSAFPGRYDQRKGEALRILRSIGGGGGGKGGRGGGGSGGSPGTFNPGALIGGGGSIDTRQIDTGQSDTSLADILGQLTQRQPAQVPFSSIPDPAYSARSRVAMPTGYQDVSSGPPAPPPPKLADMLSQLSALRGPTVNKPSVDIAGILTGASFTPGSKGSSGRGGGGGRLGRVGGSTPRGVIDRSVLPVARSVGIGVTSNGIAAKNRTHGPTSSGGRSDHQGNGRDSWAADMPAVGARGDRLARALARKFGFPTSKGLQTKNIKIGGRRYQAQLIWRAPDHFDHVHFGLHRI